MGKIERSVIKLEDAVPLSEKEIESKVSKTESEYDHEKAPEDAQISEQVSWS